MTGRSVAILGFFGGRPEAPRSSSSQEVWGLNQLYQVVPDLEWDRWFEMHGRDFIEKWKPEYVEWLKRQTKPIYMQRHHEDIPASVEYPRARVNALLGEAFGFPADYFTSTFSYMFALALTESFSRIGVYGLGLIEDGESYFERAGLEYLIGIAQGSGVDVRIETGSPLLKIHYVYGYEEPRMRVADVAPVCDFLKQSVAILDRHRRELLKIENSASDTAYRLEWDKAMLETRTNIRLLNDLVTWLKHYGRGGALIAPDGNLTEKEQP